MVSLNRIKNYYNNVDIIYNTHVIYYEFNNYKTAFRD